MESKELCKLIMAWQSPYWRNLKTSKDKKEHEMLDHFYVTGEFENFTNIKEHDKPPCITCNLTCECSTSEVTYKTPVTYPFRFHLQPGNMPEFKAITSVEILPPIIGALNSSSL